MSPVSMKVTDIKAYENNAKNHSPDQIAKIAKSISSLGWDQPIVVWTDGTIIKGHGRFLAAKSLGMERVPVIVRSDLTEDQAAAARISDNQVAIGDFDTDLLQEEIMRLTESGEIDTGILGFSDKELDFFTGDLGDLDPSAIMDSVSTDLDTASDSGEDTTRMTAEGGLQVTKILGFSKLTSAQAQILNEVMILSEAAHLTLEKGPERLFAWLGERVADLKKARKLESEIDEAIG